MLKKILLGICIITIASLAQTSDNLESFDWGYSTETTTTTETTNQQASMEVPEVRTTVYSGGKGKRIFSVLYDFRRATIEFGGITKNGIGLRITGEVSGGAYRSSVNITTLERYEEQTYFAAGTWGAGVSFGKDIQIRRIFHIIPGASLGFWMMRLAEPYPSGLSDNYYYSFYYDRVLELAFGGPFVKLQLGSQRNRFEFSFKGLLEVKENLVYRSRIDDYAHISEAYREVGFKFFPSINIGWSRLF